MSPRVFIPLLTLLLCQCGELTVPRSGSRPPPPLQESFPAETPLPTPTPEVEEPAKHQGLPPEVELEELRLVVRILAEENRELKAALNALRKPSTDGSPENPPPETTAPEPPVIDLSAVDPNVAQVLYANPTWHYIVVNRGGEAGVQLDQPISITRGGVLIAHGKVTDVKPDQSVAEINTQSLGTDGLYPKQGDRVQAR